MHIDRADIFMRTLGVETYRVGGSVRDELLGREPKDADYLVRDVPLDDLGALLSYRLKIDGYPKPSVKPLVLRDGRQCGWRVAARGLRSIEIMLPRTERPRALTPEEKLQGGGVRRAFDIVVDPNVTLLEDAQRRDFTFNALYKIIWHPQNLRVPDLMDVLDPTSCGLYDLQHKLIRTTHPDSFRDDPLRTLRALRFVSTLGYDLARDTMEQMKRHAGAVTGLSAKGHTSGTVLEELSKLLMGDAPGRALCAARDTGVLGALIPELRAMLNFAQGSRYHDLKTCEHTFTAIDTAATAGAPLAVRLALLFHDSGKPEAGWWGPDGHQHFYGQDGTKRVKLFERVEDGATEDHEVVGERLWRAWAERAAVPRELLEYVARLIRDHMVSVEGRFKPVKVRRMRVKYGDKFLHDLLLHRACDASGKLGGGRKALERVALMEQARASAQAARVPCSRKDLEIDGHDLMALGLKGRYIGGCQDLVLDEVVCDPSPLKLSREWQLERAGDYARHIDKIEKLTA